MLCQECKEKKATVHVTSIINGKKTELYLCEECAQKKGEWGFAAEPLSLHNFISGFLGGLEPGIKPKTELPGISRCEKCGLTFEEFAQKGRFGCQECYEAFSSQLPAILKKVHGREEYRGKIPRRTGGVLRKKREIEDLRKAMEKSVKEEDFEKAAEIRDKIRELEKELEG